MEDRQILSRISDLVAEEDSLHDRAVDNTLEDDERERLHNIDEALDQCWDLLRQRRALRNAGRNPDEADARSIEQVEHYEQ